LASNKRGAGKKKTGISLRMLWMPRNLAELNVEGIPKWPLQRYANPKRRKSSEFLYHRRRGATVLEIAGALAEFKKT